MLPGHRCIWLKVSRTAAADRREISYSTARYLLKAQYTLKGPVRSRLEFLAIVTLGSIAGAAVGLLLHGM